MVQKFEDPDLHPDRVVGVHPDLDVVPDCDSNCQLDLDRSLGVDSDADLDPEHDTDPMIVKWPVTQTLMRSEIQGLSCT